MKKVMRPNRYFIDSYFIMELPTRRFIHVNRCLFLPTISYITGRWSPGPTSLVFSRTEQYIAESTVPMCTVEKQLVWGHFIFGALIYQKKIFICLDHFCGAPIHSTSLGWCFPKDNAISFNSQFIDSNFLFSKCPLHNISSRFHA